MVFYFSKPHCENKRKEQIFFAFYDRKKQKQKQETKTRANHILLFEGLLFHKTSTEKCGACSLMAQN